MMIKAMIYKFNNKISCLKENESFVVFRVNSLEFLEEVPVQYVLQLEMQLHYSWMYN